MIAGRRHLLPVIWHLVPGIWYIVRRGISMQCGMLICTLIDCTVHTSNYCPELFSGLNYSAREACWVKQGEEKLAWTILGPKLGGGCAPQSICQPTNHLSLSHSHVETHPRYQDTVGRSSEREIETAAVVKHLLLCEREIGSDFDFS